MNFFLFQCIFPRQCTLKLITLTLRRLLRARGTQSAFGMPSFPESLDKLMPCRSKKLLVFPPLIQPLFVALLQSARLWLRNKLLLIR